jgi:hypothetical protein
MKPLVLIDFDGVFNAVGQQHWQKAWKDMKEIAYIDRLGYKIPVTYSPTLVEFFNILSNVADIEWLTTWKRETERMPAQLGINEFPWHDEILPWGSEWWKFDVVKKIATDNPGRKVLWIDDEIPSQTWEPERLFIFRNNWATIVPREDTGLTPEHCEFIIDFVSK